MLFLDDIRRPADAFDYTKNPIYLLKNWTVIKNYNGFVKYIEAHGVPDVISFDHDLSDEHIAPKEIFEDSEKAIKFFEETEFIEKTGHDCAKWLIEYCKKYKRKLPDYLCHSMNPVGKKSILLTLQKANI